MSAQRRFQGKDLVKLTKRILSQEGYLQAPARIARTGIQEYTALELGLDASMRTVRLYRAPDQVFRPETLASFEDKPMTFYHPEKGVDSGNWKAVAVGSLRNVRKDETDERYVAADLMVNDAEAVRAIAFDVKELSCGYSFGLDMTPGTTPDGQAYDGRQIDIEGNHLAIVYSGRCGSGCAVGDCAGGCNAKSKTNKGDRAMKTIKVNGINIDLEDKDAQIVQQGLDSSAATITSITAARDTALTQAKDLEAALKTQGEEMKRLASDHKIALDAAKALVPTAEQVAMLAADHATVMTDALSVVADFKPEGKTIAQMRLDVLGAIIAKDAADERLKGVALKMLGGATLDKAHETVVKAAFDAVVAFKGATTSADDGPAGREYQTRVVDAITGDRRGQQKKLGGRALMQARERGQVRPQ